jgi:hypothetical protein
MRAGRRLGTARALFLAATEHSQLFCQVKCRCIQICGDPEFQECVATWNTDHDVAVAKNCEADWDEWSKCIADGHGCQGGVFDAGCLEERNRWRQCTGG